MTRALPPPETFEHAGRRIAYRSLGDGDRAVVLTHGLLMDSRMYTALGPTLAAAGYRVILVDMLGHGASAPVTDMTAHSMPAYGADVIALLDHLGFAQAVIGGTSLGANVALEVAAAAPERVRALFLEMPVLENGLAGAAALFVPLALALRVSQRAVGAVATVARKIPRSHFLIDVLIDFLRRDPATSLAILDGLTFGRTAPPADVRRRLPHLALVVGHPNDLVHPFSDADRTARELVRGRLVAADSMYEWRVRPSRLDTELREFLRVAWSEPQPVAGVLAAASA
ncbi:MAG: alpha/beta fold hydrolase [Kofleriaceae bacterium]|nr:alpha/beta fold hydrolase [Kofleriaceae bacterium]MBP9166388.1 alpha/beta fold hydrolase [Kofleriaceae bacterium]MBP9858629.1 alpha/beta fold hydrolase [Kofleriaceae bacterium]